MKKNMTFEEAMERLDSIVAELDAGETPLEKSLSLYGEGAELLSFCEKKLGDAKLKIETLFPAEDKA